MNQTFQDRGARKHDRLALLFGLTLFFALICSPLLAEATAPRSRVVLTDVPYGGTELVFEELSKIEGIDLRDATWFHGQVRGRGFRVDGIENRPGDLRWVFSGSNIDWIIDIALTSDGEAYEARFIAAETSEPKHLLSLDLGDDGVTQAGAQLLRMEFEKILGAGRAEEAERAALEEKDPDALALDPEEVRRRAAAQRSAVAEQLQKNWLWAKAHGRLLRRDLFIAGQEALFSYSSGGFPGFELEVEAFPFVLSNPDMASAGVYVNYIHGFDSLNLILSGDTGDQPLSVSLGHISFEGGMIYRLDSPLDEVANQTRFKLGVRYEAFTATDNPLIPQTTMVSVVLGTRLVTPLFVDQFAVTANLDIMPLSFFGQGQELFGASSFSYGFGTELGILYEVSSGLFASVAYGFRLSRTDFTGAGQINTIDGVMQSEFVDSDAFDLFQGLKAGIVYRY